ncbi:hypothetical protein KDA_18900 [Dictyobacter alpinus]|uniref:Uncharacterized protein n=1 Tax=Dictyobacter alpinus TaxID=2014873 RepID=A0A402B4Z1_9CHLR|nr:hypothetical protein [Dictyobacter alpinus]GCE26406.1 hypothetical protein KDA_18900 [Dictyobacter alpinus]
MTQTQTLEGYSLTCPDPQEVTALLQPLAFTLHFQIAAKSFQYSAALPAQYHFRDEHGTEVIYLAGKDTPEDRIPLPAHQSRWWIYMGASEEAFHQVSRVIAARWFIAWLGGQPATHHSVA